MEAIEAKDIEKIKTLVMLHNYESFWDDVEKITKNIINNHQLGRWQCLAEQRYKEIALELWNELEDVSMDPETECNEEDWRGFPAGSHREDILHWFEETFNVSVAEDLMGQH